MKGAEEQMPRVEPLGTCTGGDFLIERTWEMNEEDLGGIRHCFYKSRMKSDLIILIVGNSSLSDEDLEHGLVADSCTGPCASLSPVCGPGAEDRKSAGE